jgi:hypothetical protein
MTGEDMIIRAVARMLREAKLSEHAELRKVFWIAGYCEHCGAAHVSNGSGVCAECGRALVNHGGRPQRVSVKDALREWQAENKVSGGRPKKV